jgi:hypothetical protein
MPPAPPGSEDAPATLPPAAPPASCESPLEVELELQPLSKTPAKPSM